MVVGGGRRHFLVRIVQHREIVFRHGTRLGIAPFTLCMLVQQFAQERRLAVGEPRDVARADAVDGEPRARLDVHFQCRTAEPVEQQPPERFESRIAGDAEADQKLELGFGLEVGRRAQRLSSSSSSGKACS